MKIGIAVLFLAFSAAAHAAPPTKLCNTGASSEILLAGIGAEMQQRVVQAVVNPSSDPQLKARLWDPIGARAATTVLDYRMAVLVMNPFQDLPEMIHAIRADFPTTEIAYVEDNGGVCFATSPPPPMGRATEYHNAILDHYFLSTTDAENTILDSGGAGPGWERTGETFRFAKYDACSGDPRVFRFYAPGSRSHFYTADPGECGGLRAFDSGWIAEGVAFGAVVPRNGACTGGAYAVAYTPLYRLYNDRAAFNDSNHRYTKSAAIYQQMMAKGWIGEGVALCVRDAP